jgi:hypothetical protein
LPDLSVSLILQVHSQMIHAKIQEWLYETWGSCGGEDVSVGLLSCNDMLKNEPVCSSEPMVSTYKSTLHFKPEDQHW